MLIRSAFFLLIAWVAWAHPTAATPVRTATITVDDLEDFDSNPPEVQLMIREALDLAGRDLGYQYGSNDPKKGGMDCSGAVQYLLVKLGVQHVPRQANLMYRWLWKQQKLYPIATRDLTGMEFSRLKPGDLLFWSGTYKVDRDPPVTHVMVYLGKMKKNGKPVMFGASSGRRYAGKAMHGVSVFDFRLPRADSSARFIAYGSIPGLVPEPPTSDSPSVDREPASD